MEHLWKIKPNRTNDLERWSKRIQELIMAAQKDAPSRVEAVSRLAYLFIQGALTAQEASAFAQALWSERDDDQRGLPARTGLFPHVFVKLPAPEEIDSVSLTKDFLFNQSQRSIFSPIEIVDSSEINQKQYNLQGLVGLGQEGVLPTPSQADAVFDAISNWQPSVESQRKEDPIFIAFADHADADMRSTIGWALYHCVVPAIPIKERTEEKARKLIALIEAQKVQTALLPLPFFVQEEGKLCDDVKRLILRGLRGQGHDEVNAAAFAVRKWQELAQEGEIPLFPRQFIDQIIFLIEMQHEPGLTALLWVITELSERHVLTADDHDRLLAAMRDIFEETQYAAIALESHKAVSAPLLRSACVRLADVFSKQGIKDMIIDQWLALVGTDPLPEVRYALEEAAP